MADPITVSLAAGAGVFWLLSRNRPAAAASPITKPKLNCSDAFVQRTVMNTAQGASAGAATGPYGAAAGGVLGAALGQDALACGQAALSKARAALCAKTDQLVNEMAKRGVAKPPKYSTWSCDQKIAFAAGLGGFGVAYVLGGLGVTLTNNTVDELKRVWNTAGNVAGNIGQTVAKAGRDIEKAVNPLRGLGDMDAFSFAPSADPTAGFATAAASAAVTAAEESRKKAPGKFALIAVAGAALLLFARGK